MKQQPNQPAFQPLTSTFEVINEDFFLFDRRPLHLSGDLLHPTVTRHPAPFPPSLRIPTLPPPPPSPPPPSPLTPTSQPVYAARRRTPFCIPAPLRLITPAVGFKSSMSGALKAESCSDLCLHGRNWYEGQRWRCEWRSCSVQARETALTAPPQLPGVNEVRELLWRLRRHRPLTRGTDGVKASSHPPRQALSNWRGAPRHPEAGRQRTGELGLGAPQGGGAAEGEGETFKIVGT